LLIVHLQKIDFDQISRLKTEKSNLRALEKYSEKYYPKIYPKRATHNLVFSSVFDIIRKSFNHRNGEDSKYSLAKTGLFSLKDLNIKTMFCCARNKSTSSNSGSADRLKTQPDSFDGTGK